LLIFFLFAGFDFNRFFKYAISYEPKNRRREKKGDRPIWGNRQDDPSEQDLYSLFQTLIDSRKPIIVHHGLFDLLFVYDAFIGKLPNSLEQFTAELHRTFPLIYDTKWIFDRTSDRDLNATFLEYIFAKKRRKNMKEREAGNAHINYHSISLPSPENGKKTGEKRKLAETCRHYAVRSYSLFEYVECDFFLEIWKLQ